MSFKRSFINDDNGFTQKDYMILFVTIIYALIIIPIIISVLLFPDKYDEEILSFLMDITETASSAYAIIVSFFFVTKKTQDILHEIFEFRKNKSNNKV